MQLEVGQAYPAAIRTEGGWYSYHAEHDLLLAFRNFSRREIDDVRRSAADFALFSGQGILFFLYRFGSVGWGDCPYSWHLDPVALPELPTGEERILLPVTLVELPENIVRVIRAISLPPEFSRRLVLEIRKQSTQAPMDRSAYNAAIDQTYRGVRIAAMVGSSLVRCRGVR